MRFCVEVSLNLPPPAGGSPFHTKVQRSRRHQQLWRLRRGGDPRFSNRKVRQGVCGVLEGEKVDISGKWSGIFALFKKTWDGAKTVFFSNLRSPFIPRRPHMAEWGQHNPQVPITSHCLIHLGIKADTSLFSFLMHTFFFFFLLWSLFNPSLTCVDFQEKRRPITLATDLPVAVCVSSLPPSAVCN